MDADRCETSARVAAIVAQVRARPKYRSVAPDVIARIVARELAAHASPRDALAATRRKLHQILAAYWHDRPDGVALGELVATLADAAARTPGDLKAACAAAMAHHASSRERLCDLDTFYARIFAATGPPRSVLDVACGLDPLALPWMGLAPGTAFWACDIDAQLVAFLDQILAILPVRGAARVRDALAWLPGNEAWGGGAEGGVWQGGELCPDADRRAEGGAGLARCSAPIPTAPIPMAPPLIAPSSAEGAPPMAAASMPAGVDPSALSSTDRVPGAGAPASAAVAPSQGPPCVAAPTVFDVAFVLKALPCLDRQRRGAGAALVRALPAHWVVVSFPTRTLGGRDKAMASHYEAVYGAALRPCGEVAAVLRFATELVMVVDKRGGGGHALRRTGASIT